MKRMVALILFLYGCSEAKSPEDEEDEETEENEEEEADDTGEDDPEDDGVLVINEISIDPVETEDWIEFYNSTVEDADVGDWLIGDDLEEMYAVSELSDNTIVPAGGFLVVFTKVEDGNGEEIGFGLKKDGSEPLFVIMNGEGNAIQMALPAPEVEDLTYGRVPDGSETWENNLEPSFEDFNN